MTSFKREPLEKLKRELTRFEEGHWSAIVKHGPVISTVGALSRPSNRDNRPSIHPSHPSIPLIGLTVQTGLNGLNSSPDQTKPD